MEGEGKWCREAMEAMDTHLWHLQRANQCETDETTGRRPKPACLSGQCATDMAGPGPSVDLNSHRPLPHGWEQFLDLQTGQVYYIDWKRCRRSYMDPRVASLGDSDMDDSSTLDSMSDADASHTLSTDGRKEVCSKLTTSPLLQEDWDLMEIRGWMPLDSDDRSEIISGVTPPDHLVISAVELGCGKSSKSVIKEEPLCM